MRWTFGVLSMVVVFCSGRAASASEGTSGAAVCGSFERAVVEEVGEDRAICVLNSDEAEGARWLLVGAEGERTELGVGLSDLHVVDSLESSSDRDYLAVISVGEGHPILEVVDLRRLLAEKAFETLWEVNPWPGFVAILGWRDGTLRLQSDMPLFFPPDESRLIPSQLLLPKPEEFSLDPATGVISGVSFDAPDLLAYEVERLGHQEMWERAEAARALRTLAREEALPALREALAGETDPEVRAVIEAALEGW